MDPSKSLTHFVAVPCIRLPCHQMPSSALSSETARISPSLPELLVLQSQLAAVMMRNRSGGGWREEGGGRQQQVHSTVGGDRLQRGARAHWVTDMFMWPVTQMTRVRKCNWGWHFYPVKCCVSQQKFGTLLTWHKVRGPLKILPNPSTNGQEKATFKTKKHQP